MSARKRPTPASPGDLTARQIREFHALGERVRARAEVEGSVVLRAARLVAIEEGISYDRARKAARFAGQRDEAGLAKLDAICAIRPITVNHVRRVLKLKPAAQDRWLRRAARSGWQAHRLAGEVRRDAGGEARAGGPSIRVPEDPFELIEQVIDATAPWLKKYDASWTVEGIWPAAADVEGDRTDLARRVGEARRMLKHVAVCATELEARLGRLERSLKRKIARSD
jgi:hypothetical protein